MGPRRYPRRGFLPDPYPERPRVMASLRNLAITILRLTGHACIAAALRYHARRHSRPLQTITHC